MKPLISIIIPAYKDTYLDECINSIIKQSYDNWQLIVVNDGSPYNLDTIINKYNDNRIHYSKREKGIGSERLVDNWNECLEIVTGEYVINMGDDDILLPECFAEYVRLIEQYPKVDVFHGWTEIINEHSEVTDICPKHPPKESVYGFIQRIWKGETLYIGDVLIRTSKLRAIGGYQYFPMAWHSDHITAFAAAFDNGVVSTEQIVFGYRKHSRTISNSKQNVISKLNANKQAFNWYANFIQRENANADTTDNLLRKCLLNMLPYQFNRKTCQDISEGCKHKPWRVVAYLPNLIKLGMGFKTILRAMAYSL